MAFVDFRFVADASRAAAQKVPEGVKKHEISKPNLQKLWARVNKDMVQSMQGSVIGSPPQLSMSSKHLLSSMGVPPVPAPLMRLDSTLSNLSMIANAQLMPVSGPVMLMMSPPASPMMLNMR